MATAVHEAFNACRFDRLAELLAADVALITPGQAVRGRRAVVDYAVTARTVPGMLLEHGEVLAETEDTIVCQTRAVPASSQAYGQTAPSGDAQTITQCEVYRIRTGRITEIRLYRNRGSADEPGTGRVIAEQSALRRVATLVAQGAATQAVFDQVAVETGRLLDGAPVSLARLEPPGGVRIVAAAGSGTPAGTWFSAEEGGMGRIRRTGRAVRIDDIRQAPPYVMKLGFRAVVLAPIVVAGRLWGGIAAYSREAPLPAGTEERLSQFAELVATAIANAESHAELTASRARVVAGADEARRRLARDVHDGAQRRLVHALIAVKQARAAMTKADDPAAALVAETLRQTQGAYDELRRLAHGLLPAALEQGGLQTAVEALVADIELAVETDIIDKRLPETVETTAYFLIAEALTNTVKHADAGRVRVRAVPDGNWLTVEVTDDGCGAADPDRGSGLLGLSDRVQAAGGTISVTSPQGAGTTVSATLPLASQTSRPPPAAAAPSDG
jgi:signal transduction histidine kinase